MVKKSTKQIIIKIIGAENDVIKIEKIIVVNFKRKIPNLKLFLKFAKAFQEVEEKVKGEIHFVSSVLYYTPRHR
jgi:hypothetical protein